MFSTIDRFIERVGKRRKNLIHPCRRKCGFEYDLDTVPSDEFEIDINHLDSIHDLAIEFVDEGLFGEIPDRLKYYIEYDSHQFTYLGVNAKIHRQKNVI
mgnify:CR=1 FL=1